MGEGVVEQEGDPKCFDRDWWGSDTVTIWRRGPFRCLVPLDKYMLPSDKAWPFLRRVPHVPVGQRLRFEAFKTQVHF